MVLRRSLESRFPTTVFLFGIAAKLASALRMELDEGVEVSDEVAFLKPNDPMRTVLEAQNTYRCMHRVGPLRWDAGLAMLAKRHAVRAKGKMRHSSIQALTNVNGFSSVGENLAMLRGSDDSSEGVHIWYSEIERTSPRGSETQFSGGPRKGTAQYTQLVWANTTAVGCYRTVS
eukprot:TRINITY_DN9040_c0_g1_i3.p2 TRINITY_DN9040_c0_g1~~TRINITY_DN9040_c0_g1_i3.p2  ORF type:complete len:174 (-),score=22.93 TRINITY_DN9040_c0_g1_i3:148-669(-)